MARVAVRQDRVNSNLSATRLRTKKRKRDISKTVVGVLISVLIAQAIAALYYSPFFAVTAETVTVKSTPLCPDSIVRSLVQPDLPRSVVRLPVQRWNDALENIPAVKSASIVIRFPNRLNVRIVERLPCLKADLGTLGMCVLDSDLIPFRVAESGDNNLPTVRLQSADVVPELGTSIGDKAQVAGVNVILEWMSNHPNIAVSSINIQNKHLAFTFRSSDVNVLLGTPRRLEEKLASLDILLKKRPELLTSRKYSSVNLFSDEYPALVFRSNTSNKIAVP